MHFYIYNKEERESKKSRRLIQAHWGRVLIHGPCQGNKKENDYQYIRANATAVLASILHKMVSSFISCIMTLKLGEVTSQKHPLLCFHNRQTTKITNELKPLQ